MLLSDTLRLLCYLHQGEAQQEQAVLYFDRSHQSLTHSYVLAELIALTQVRRFPRTPTLNFLNDLLDHPDIEVIWVNELLYHFEKEMLQ